MFVSVFTPSNDPRWLDEAHQSLLAQTFGEWEWVVLLNGAAGWRPVVPDERVKVRMVNRVKGVGDAKRRAVALTCGDVLVELDHDDLLLPRGLESILEALDRKPSHRFVYSDCAEIEADGAPRQEEFRADNGWEYSDLPLGHQHFKWCHSMAATPHNLSLIWFAPNHVRAFTRDLYDQVGGYDPSLRVLDDQDLMCKMFEKTSFSHIPECLYLQRRHPANTQADTRLNAYIQSETVRMGERWLERLYLAWASREGLVALDISSDGPRDGYASPPAGSTWPGSLAGNCSTLQLDLPDDSVGIIRVHEALQLLSDKVGSLDEIYRVLAHGGLASVSVPSTDGRGAFQDPRHVSFWNENSFWYVTDRNLNRFVPAIRARFQARRLETLFPSPWHRQHCIPYVVADLLALKDGPRQGGFVRL